MRPIARHLTRLGLTSNESKAYLALLPLKDAKASEIALSARIPRNKIYEIMQSLHKKGFVAILPEKVTRFKTVDFDTATQYQLDRWKRKMESLIRTKESISKYLKSVAASDYKDEVGEFTILKAKKIIYRKLESFLDTSEKAVAMMINVSDLRRLYHAAREAAKRIELRVLVPINKEDKDLIKQWAEFSDIRHYQTQTQVKIAIVDDTEVLAFQTNNAVALHSKDRQFTGLLKVFFDSAWESSPAGKEKIAEIETGKPVEEIKSIRGRKEIFDAIRELLHKSKHEVTINTTAAGLVRINKYFREYLEGLEKRGVKIMCIAPVTKGNMDAAKKLSMMQIRHTSKTQAVMACFDRSYLLLFHIKKDTTGIDSPEDYAIITNQASTVATMCQMFDNMWADSVLLDARINELKTGKPVEKVEILRGNETIYEATKGASRKAMQGVCTISTEFSPERAVRFGTFGADKEIAGKGVKMRFVFPITEKNAHLIKGYLKFAEVRHIGFSPLRVRIIDDKACFVRYGGEEFVPVQEQACIFSTSPNYVSTMKHYFDHIWKEAVPAEERMHELETGMPPEKTEVIKGSENVFDNITDAIMKSRKDLFVCVTEYGMRMALTKRKEMLQRLKRKGVRIRYIAAITEKTLEMAKELSGRVELRHFDFPVRLIVTDSECMLIASVENDEYPKELVRSNSHSMVTHMRELLENVWLISVPAEERIKQIENGTAL